MTAGDPPTDEGLRDHVNAIRDEYGRRERAPQCIGEYSFLNPVHARLVLDRERALLAALSAYLDVDVSVAEALDVGCGVGSSLALLVAYGFDPSRLHGVDILDHRIAHARARMSAADVRVTNGYTLPYDDGSFDLVQQITMLSSVHDDVLRLRIADEMTRVLKPDGLLLSYDAAPISLFARALNRFAATASRGARDAVGPRAPEDHERVELTPIRPLSREDLERLFPLLSLLRVERVTPYRPLAVRAAGSDLMWYALSRSDALSSALLYVARKPR